MTGFWNKLIENTKIEEEYSKIEMYEDENYVLNCIVKNSIVWDKQNSLIGNFIHFCVALK